MTDRKPNAAQQIMFGVPKEAPTLAAGWAQYEALARGRGWPETVIEIARQAYFAGADRVHELILALPMDANVVGRFHEALNAELRSHDQEMVAMREARKARDE